MRAPLHISLLLCLLSLDLLLPAQQLPVFNQYLYNSDLYNPAAAGAAGVHQLYLGQRSQWLGLGEGPSTQILSYQGAPLGSPALGLGVTLVNDRAHLIQQTRLLVGMAYHLGELAQTGQFSVGVNLGLNNHRLRLGQDVTIADPGDPLVLGQTVGSTGLDAGLGLRYRYQTERFGFQAGLATQQLPRALEVADGLVFALRSHLMTHLSFRYQAGQVGLEPNVLIRGLGGEDVLGGGGFDAGVRAWFADDKFWVSAGTRNSGGGLHTALGLNLEQFQLTAAFENHRQLGASLELGVGTAFGTPPERELVYRREPYWEDAQQLESRLSLVRPQPQAASVSSDVARKYVRLTYSFEDDEDEYNPARYASTRALLDHLNTILTDMQDETSEPHLNEIESITLTGYLRESKATLEEPAYIEYAGEWGERLVGTFAIDGQTLADVINTGTITKAQLAYLKLLGLKKGLAQRLGIPETRFITTLRSGQDQETLRELRIEILMR
ncbi:MAG: type IX secretion system membrane protein PorP/SprF [Bacteroidetes bacterium]|nr:MAG: type IX secretion system membrane protein PorP/SprF [Bacteroidota bacterium]